jgi:hypothetical protein
MYFRPDYWLEKGHSNKLNIRTFNSKNAALAFLQKYNQWNFVKAQKVNQKNFFFRQIYFKIN